MLKTIDVSKIKKKSSSTISPLFLMSFQQIWLLFSEYAYFSERNINNFRKACFFPKTRLVTHTHLCGNISRHKCNCTQFVILTSGLSGLGNGILWPTFRISLTSKRACPKINFLIGTYFKKWLLRYLKTNKMQTLLQFSVAINR